MFQISIFTDQWHTIYGTSEESLVINPVMKQKLNGCGSVEFSIPVSDKYYDDYTQFKTKVRVSEDGTLLFVGRLLDINKDFNGTKNMIFEGEMAYLNDVQYPPYEYSGTIAGLLQQVLEYYNSHCTVENRITKGRITVTDNNNYIARSNTNYSSCWECLNEKIIKLCGGYMQMRWVVTGSDVYRYLDYLEDPGAISSQSIEFGENILDVKQELQGADIITVLIPYGAEDEETKERVNITSVNPTGKNYIVSSKYAKYGLIEHVEYWDDVTLPQNLYNKAVAYLAQHDTSITTLTINAVDLHAVDEDIARLNVGDTVHVKSVPHGIDTNMIITERNRNLADVSKDTFTIGKQVKTLTSKIDSNGMKVKYDVEEYVEEIKTEVIQAVEQLIPSDDHIETISERQTKIMLGGSGGCLQILSDIETGKPVALRIMDNENEAEALNVWLFNENGLGFSNNGINGPFFNAWTIDGHLSADSLYTGTLQSRDGSFVLDLDSGTLKVTGIEQQINQTQENVSNLSGNVDSLKDRTDTIEGNYVNQNDSEYKKLTTSVNVGNDGVIIKGSTNGSDNPTSLKINSSGVFIQDKMNNVITSMTTNEFRTGKWVLQQTNDNKSFNLFKEK